MFLAPAGAAPTAEVFGMRHSACRASMVVEGEDMLLDVVRNGAEGLVGVSLSYSGGVASEINI